MAIPIQNQRQILHLLLFYLEIGIKALQQHWFDYSEEQIKLKTGTYLKPSSHCLEKIRLEYGHACTTTTTSIYHQTFKTVFYYYYSHKHHFSLTLFMLPILFSTDIYLQILGKFAFAKTIFFLLFFKKGPTFFVEQIMLQE